MNQNFLVETAAGQFVLRLYNHKTERETRFERLMLRELAAHDFPCPKPRLTTLGRDYVIIADRPAILYPLLSGTKPKKATVELMTQVGRLQGQLHKHFLGRRPPISKKGWDPADIRYLIPQWRSRIVRSGFPDAKRHLDFISHELKRCHFPADLPRGFTHQDIKPENTLVSGGRTTGILDFDNCYVGALLHDLTTTIIWWCFPHDRLDMRLVRAFLRGYETERRLTADEKKLLLADGLRFRLLREMFIGPITTLDKISLAAKRAGNFLKLYRTHFG
jgi:homoserine kinase type II